MNRGGARGQYFYSKVSVLFLEIYSHWNLVLTTLKSQTGLDKFTTDLKLCREEEGPRREDRGELNWKLF